MKINLLFLRKLCIQHVCIFLFILIGSQVSATASDADGKNTFESMQQTSISGTVTDNTGKPVPGVTVLVKGTTNGTVTDNNGRYTLNNVEARSVVSFSFVGMVTVEATVGTQRVIDVVLSDESFSLEEVVAVGYATQKRATLTGSVASVRNEELVVTKNENVANMLTGKMPGVRVVQKSSAPGDYNTVIDIRGMGTPLFVIDGVTRDQAYFVRMDPQEIESISVLKDGAAAIYGLRAANGVILITTKSGTAQDGKVDITYSGNYSVQQFLSVPEGVSALDYMTLFNESTWQNFNTNYLVRQNPVFSQADMQPYIDGKPSYNWMDAIFNKNTPQHQHNLSLNGGNEKLRYFMSLAYANQEGSYKSGDFKNDKWNFRSTIDANITNRLKAKANIGAILDTRTSPQGSGWDFYKASWLMRPDAPIYANDNPLYLNGDASKLADGRNMVAEMQIAQRGYDIRNTRRLNGMLQMSYDIPGVKGLSARASYDYAMNLPDNTTYRNAYPLYIYNSATDIYTPSIKNSPSTITRSASFNFDTDLQLGFYYNNRFDKHNVNSFLIFQEAYSKWDNFSAYRELLIASEYLFAGEDLNQRAQGGLPGDRLSQSLIGSFTYDFSEKYLVDFKFRYDGSSRFPKGKRWGFFPSVSAGWRISEESFMKDNLPFISNMKLRASYGEMGDDAAASNYPPTLGFSLNNNVSWVFNNILNAGVVPQSIPNPNLTWYEIKMYNIALDFGLLRNKLSGTFELFQRDRSGLLATSAAVVPGTVGASLPQENLNSDRNFGWEVSLDYRNKFRDFSYSIGGQIFGIRSMRTDWLEGLANNQYHHWRTRTSGRYNNIWWGNESHHMFTSLEEIRSYHRPMGQGSLPGDWILNDWNEDGVVDGNDDHPIATNGLPLFNYGINLGASWKNFDMVALFQGAFGVYMQLGELLVQPLPFNGQNTLSYFMDRWRPADPNADFFSTATQWIPGYYPVTGRTGRREGSNLVQDASYMRLKTLEVGYTLPRNLVSKVGIKSLRVYMSGYNILTFTGLEYVDPERSGPDPSTTGTPYVDFYSYPVNKTYSLGAVIKF